MMRYVPVLLPSTLKIEFLRRFKPLHDGTKKRLVGRPSKSSKLVASHRPKTAFYAVLDEIVYNLREFARHVAENIVTDFDRHSVHVMSVKFFDLQLELILY